MKKSLADLEIEFDKDQNAPLTFDQVTKGRSKPVIWTCADCGHSWSTRVYNRLNGSKCPRCSGAIPISGATDLATLFPHIAAEWDYLQNTKGPEEYLPHSNKDVHWICKNGHRWKAKINNRTSNGLGCPYCNEHLPTPGINDLGTLFPWLAEQWNQEENGDLTPSDVFPKSNKRVSWKCKKGHVWNAKIYHRTDGEDCPYCSGLKPFIGETDLETLAPELAHQWHKQLNGNRLPSEFTRYSHFKAFWLCDKGHEYPMSIYKRSLGYGCSVCDGKRIVPGINDLASQAPNLAAEWDYAKNTDSFPDKVALHNNRKYYWICSKCGHSWAASPNNRVRGTGCPKCAGFVVDPKVNSFAARNPHLIDQWDIERNRPFTAWDIAAYDNRSYYWICENNHSFFASPSNRTIGRGCPYCSGRLPVVGQTDLTTCSPLLIKHWSFSKNIDPPERFFPSSTKRVWWECDAGHCFLAPINEMALRWRCPHCLRKKKSH